MSKEAIASTPGEGRLEDSIKEIFAPILRADGFKGSGRVYRRVVGELINVVDVQGSQWGGRFAVNLGIQPLAVPDLIGDRPDASKIVISKCEFTRRLAEGRVDQWWEYEPTRASMDRAIRQAASLYMAIGREMFAAMNGPASPILAARPEDLEAGRGGFQGFGSSSFRRSLVLARLRCAQERYAESRGFAELALAAHPGMSDRLREELVALAKER